MLRTGRAEASVFWRDESSGVECRARPDWLHRPTGKGRDIICLDLKTTVDAAPDAFSRSINTYGYHRQAAHYTAGLEAEGFRVVSFVFAVVTSSAPFVSVAYVLDDATISQAEQERAELLDTYARCNSANEWPAYGAGLQLIGLPAWARRAEEIEVGYV
jgi:exodeoxyribonuclease VIII